MLIYARPDYSVALKGQAHLVVCLGGDVAWQVHAYLGDRLVASSVRFTSDAPDIVEHLHEQVQRALADLLAAAAAATREARDAA